MEGLGSVEYRAFLSHSSVDKDLVRSVVRLLGRPFVRVDYHEFGTGAEFLHAIEKSIEQSGLFVFFASKASVASLWVGHEISEAQYLSTYSRVLRPLVYIVDKSVSVNDLPRWMQRSKVSETKSAALIAGDLQAILDEQVRERQHDIFVGRSQEVKLLEEVLAPADGSVPARLFAITGLLGIGRRTLLARVARDILSLRRLLEIEVESGDSLRDVASKIADQVEPVGSTQQSLDRYVEIQKSTDGEAIERSLANLRTAIAFGALPVFIDAGGLLRNDGRFEPAVQDIVRAASIDAELYIAAVASRRPVNAELVEQAQFPSVQVRPLEDVEMRRLVVSVARKLGQELAPRQIADLATQCRGYPPSARYALELVRHYGAPVVLANTDQLVQFRASPMLRYLREVAQQPIHQQLLRILAANSPLPLEVLTQVVSADSKKIAKVLLELIDLALVVPDPDGWYRISSPVVEAVAREYRDPSADIFKQVAGRLKTFLRSAGPGVRYVELERVRYRALAMSGSFGASQEGLSMAADWIRLAEQLYHDRLYQRSLEFGRLAVEARPENSDSHRWLISALIKLGDFTEAGEALDEMFRYGMRREGLYLEGFMERHKNNHRKAVDLYEQAQSAGYSGTAIHREMASCYLELGDLESARREIDEAQRRSRDNRYVVDLLIRIACQQRDEETAVTLLKVLDEVDDPHFVAHRRSRVAAQFGHFEEAYVAAIQAAGDDVKTPSHEALCNLAFGCIRTRRFEEAERTLTRVDRTYPRRQVDVRTGLRCRLAIAQGRFEEALGIWSGLDDKTRPVHLGLRRDALRGIQSSTSLGQQRLDEIKAEIASLDSQLARVVNPDSLNELGSA
jgi:tetratricopeptide (TPR) repeat protein